MIDQEQTTQTNETENLEETTTSGSREQGSSTSTTDQTQTDQTDENIDLSGSETKQTADTTDTEENEDTRTDEEKAADEARAALFGAPAEGENYQIEGLPEGMAIDTEALEAITPALRELNLSNAGASKIAQVYAEKILPGVAKQAIAGIEQDIIAQRADWEKDAVAAVKSNGVDLKNAAGEALTFDGKPMEEVRKVAAKALDRIAPEGFREWLKDTGLSVHPKMVAFAYQAGRLLSEDTDLEANETSTKKGSSPRRVAKAGGMDPNKFYER